MEREKGEKRENWMADRKHQHSSDFSFAVAGNQYILDEYI
jgi:hypothetical protein